MEFIFETEYGQKEMTIMARALRKTLRKKRSKRSHIFGWIVVALSLLLTLPIGDKVFTLDSTTIINCLIVLILSAALILEDNINGYVAKKRMLKGMERVKTTFQADGYYSESEIGNTEWQYDKISSLSETHDYFVFIFSPNHAQIYNKKSLSGGTEDEFRQFIQDNTNKEIILI